MNTNYSSSSHAVAARRYYYTHREQILAKSRERYSKNEELRKRARAAVRAYRLANIEYTAKFDRLRVLASYYAKKGTPEGDAKAKQLRIEMRLHQMSLRNRRQPMQKSRIAG